MNSDTRQRLFDSRHAFDDPFVRAVVIALVVILIFVPALVALLQLLRKLSPALKKDLWQRYFSWLIFIPMIFVPILLGAAYTIIAVGLLSLFCYREFARATGLFRARLISTFVVLGILAITFSVFDHWYGLFVALTSLTLGSIAAAGLIADSPKGYIQRVALGIFAFLLFGVCYGHLGYFANDTHYRSILLWLIATVELNDIFAYITGKSFGHRKLAPHTSPNKTVGGAIGALLCTAALAATLGHFVFRETRLDSPLHLITLGLLISFSGQIGDLTLSSIKRDLGIKDWASTFPGHGGLLDRFNSLLFAAPVVFHYVGYFVGVGLDQQTRIITG